MKERVRSVLEGEGLIENKRRGGGIEIDWTCVWRIKTRKKKWKLMDENEWKERKNNIKNKKILIEKYYHNIFTINFK